MDRCQCGKTANFGLIMLRRTSLARHMKAHLCELDEIVTCATMPFELRTGFCARDTHSTMFQGENYSIAPMHACMQSTVPVSSPRQSGELPLLSLPPKVE